MCEHYKEDLTDHPWSSALSQADPDRNPKAACLETSLSPDLFRILAGLCMNHLFDHSTDLDVQAVLILRKY